MVRRQRKMVQIKIKSIGMANISYISDKETKRQTRYYIGSLKLYIELFYKNIHSW